MFLVPLPAGFDTPLATFFVPVLSIIYSMPKVDHFPSVATLAQVFYEQHRETQDCNQIKRHKHLVCVRLSPPDTIRAIRQYLT